MNQNNNYTTRMHRTELRYALALMLNDEFIIYIDDIDDMDDDIDEEDTIFNNMHIINNEEIENFSNLEDVKVVITKEEFKLMNHKPFSKKTKIYSECSICLENFKTRQLVTTLGCNHQLHKKCAKNLFCKHSIKCPNCRYDIRNDIEQKIS